MLDLELGDDVWKQELTSVSTPLALAGDTVYAATESGAIFAFDSCSRAEEASGCRTPAGEPVWYTLLRGPPSTGPLVLADWLVIAALDSVYLLDRFSGMRRSAAQSPGIAIGEVASDGERIFLATEEGSLLAWRTPDLELLWQTSGFGNFLSGPVLDGPDGFAVTRTGQVVRFDAADGASQIIADCEGAVMAPPTLVRNGLLVGTLEGQLHFMTRNGQPLWQIELDGSVEAPMFVHASRILVAVYGKFGGPLGSPLRGKVVELR
jgi:outer membrane protein assembly factor BamB